MTDLNFFGVASFEERCAVGIRNYEGKIGNDVKARFAMLDEKESMELSTSVKKLSQTGVTNIKVLDRFKARSLWDWVWQNVNGIKGRVVLDVSCMTRELVGMFLFALSLRKKQFEKISVLYVSAPILGYATMNPTLPNGDKWLSKGIYKIRSILGYPGDFSPHKRGHVVALSGHEKDRLMEIIEYLEPERLSISGEMENSSVVLGANTISSQVAEELRSRIALNECQSFGFTANSISGTVKGLEGLDMDLETENVTLVAMNTKLSFTGAACFALKHRSIRMVYGVPLEYNTKYTSGIGELYEEEITPYLHDAEI
jgi:hypothetical protein